MRPTRRLSGFTLVELMITLLVAAILLGLAVPGFTAFIRSNRAEVQVQSLVNSLNYARSEAVKRGQSVRITTLGGDANWHSGWRIWVNRDGNNIFDAANDDEVQVIPAFSGEATLTTGVLTEVAFNSRGHNTTAGVVEGDTTSFTYLVPSHCRLDRNISINHLGRVSVARGVCP